MGSMTAQKVVTVIPQRVRQVAFGTMEEKMVVFAAAYARVSTDDEEQRNSYAAQIEYYTRYIQQKEGWTFAGLYTDVGSSYGQNPQMPVWAFWGLVFMYFNVILSPPWRPWLDVVATE